MNVEQQRSEISQCGRMSGVLAAYVADVFSIVDLGRERERTGGRPVSKGFGKLRTSSDSVDPPLREDGGVGSVFSALLWAAEAG